MTIPSLLQGPTHDATTYRPTLFEADDPAAQQELCRVLASPNAPCVCDSLLAQVRELMAVRHPRIAADSMQVDERAREYIAGRDPATLGNWALYAWSRQLVHVLPRADFRELRTSRNRHKISADEQHLLSNARIGVVGLSVGYSVALALALEGIGGAFLLADFDTLSLSNMNRLPHSLADIGLNKAILAARRLYGIDPYLDIEVHAEGFRPPGDADCFTWRGGLSVVVDECDDLAAKLRLRQLARKHRVPVVMETNDRGMLDVERFDLEPKRPVFHNLLGDLKEESLRGLSAREKAPFIVSLLGRRQMSPALAASLFEIDATIAGWPQLGSGTLLGGAVVADAVRRMLLGRFTQSGRFYVDLEQLVSDDAPGRSLTRAEMSPAPAAAARLPTRRPPRLAPRTGRPPDASFALDLVAHAVLAPSAGNSQPWSFQLDASGELHCDIDPDRSQSYLDFERRAAHLALGGAIENISLAAAASGWQTEVLPFPSPEQPLRVASVRFHAGDEGPPELLPYLTRRCTNRSPGTREPISAAEREALELRATGSGACLHWLSDTDELDEAGEIIGEVDRYRLLSRVLHGELVSEVRWDDGQAARTRDGIDIATLELSNADRAALELIAHWPVAEFLRSINGGSALVQGARRSVRASSALCLLTCADNAVRAYLGGGRALQRVWLEATRLGLDVQPLSVAPYLFARLLSDDAGLAPEEARSLRGLWRRFQRLFGVGSDRAMLLLFRVFRGPAPSVRSLRRPADDVLRLPAQ